MWMVLGVEPNDTGAIHNSPQNVVSGYIIAGMADMPRSNLAGGQTGSHQMLNLMSRQEGSSDPQPDHGPVIENP